MSVAHAGISHSTGFLQTKSTSANFYYFGWSKIKIPMHNIKRNLYITPFNAQDHITKTDN